MVDSDELTDDELTGQGWERRSILDISRLDEVVEMYRELGFEVLVRDFDPTMVTDPDSCIECTDDKVKVVYTRRPSDHSG